MVQIDVNYSIILLAFLFENTYFPKDKFINSKSMLMRYIIYIRANIVSSSFIYTIVIRKVDREVIKFMFFTAILLDIFVCNTIKTLHHLKVAFHN